MGTDAIGQIKGYASAVSVNKGQNITFYVSVNPAQSYNLDIYRIGYYQGLGGRLVQHIGPLNGVRQATCPIDPTMGTIECRWTPSYTLTVPTSWTSGIYVGTLTNAQGFKNYMMFVVRDDSRVAALVYNQPVTTYQANNNYPKRQPDRKEPVRLHKLWSDHDHWTAFRSEGLVRPAVLRLRPGGNARWHGGDQFHTVAGAIRI